MPLKKGVLELFYLSRHLHITLQFTTWSDQHFYSIVLIVLPYYPPAFFKSKKFNNILKCTFIDMDGAKLQTCISDSKVYSFYQVLFSQLCRNCRY